ncbi:hypothetical protein FQN54_008921 [Arachnomyces sp. PD_36]|nr:hypothetical protein FQN54_008921 [Arachnomyces sp. PD_36]
MATDDNKTEQSLVPWVYDTVLWFFSLTLDIFFREIYPRGVWRVPERGPVIIVAAPHANQFVDSVILMRLIKAHKNRRVAFLIAKKSMKEPYVGALAGCMGPLPVARAMDNVKPGKGTIYQPDPEGDPCLIHGVGTDFTAPEYMVDGLIVLPRVGKTSGESSSIAEILGGDKLRVKKPFKSPNSAQQLTLKVDKKDNNVQKGTTFKVAPHIDQKEMFEQVFEGLSAGGCIGIFPEGGSHDRSDLLPLKAGAAMMALGALSRDPDCGLSIVPCGMNYFHAHKFRSRAVIEFGEPIKVHPDQVDAYNAGGNDRRNAVGSLLETIYEGLATVTQISPDQETLLMIQATRRLYLPVNKKLPLSLVIKFNRRLLKGYTKYKDDPRVINLKKAVLDYNRQLLALGIKDHQIEWGNFKERPWWLTLYTLLYRLTQLILFGLGTLPGLVLFWPVFVTCKVISVRKRRAALAGSVVKLRGHDVVTTWKCIVAMVLAPALYTFYTVAGTVWLYYNRIGGYYSSQVPWWMLARTYVPDSVPLGIFAFFFCGITIFVSFAALRLGEIGMDILKSFPPMIVALNPRSADSLVKLRAHREALSQQVSDVVNTLGPEIYPDFDAERTTAFDIYNSESYQSQLKTMPPSPSESGSRSRRSSSGVATTTIKPLTRSSTSKEDLQAVNRKIRNAMRERGRRRTKSEYGIPISEFSTVSRTDSEESGSDDGDRKGK